MTHEVRFITKSYFMPIFQFRINQKPIHEESHFISQIWNRLSNGPIDNNLIVCRANSSSNKLTRFIIIYRNRNEQFRDDFFKLKFTIQDFEIPIVKQASLVSINDKVNKKTWYVKNELEMFEILKRIGVSPGDFNFPEFCNYPF